MDDNDLRRTEPREREGRGERREERGEEREGGMIIIGM